MIGKSKCKLKKAIKFWIRWFILFTIKFFSFAIILILASPAKTLASACCGGAFSIPAIITGDDKAQVSTSFAQSRIQADVSADGIWRKRASEDTTQVFKLDAAHIFSDRWQAGFSAPIQSRTKAGSQGGTSSGPGDVAFQAAYEYLPDWDYNPLRPKGVGFLTLTLPTGKSIYESLDEDAGLSARGRGFLAIGTGTVLTKIYRAWDMSATIEGHRSFAKSYQQNTLTPGYGGSMSFGGGWNTQFFRIGGAISWTHEDAVEVSGSISSKGDIQRYATGTLAASYIFPDLWAGTISYSDQSLFGNPANTSLSQSVLVLLQKRWNR